MIRKSIKIYSSNNSSRKQINISKNELVNESEVYLYTVNEHKNISSTIDSLNKEVESLKEQLHDKEVKIKELENDLKSSVEDAISGLQDTIQENQDLIHDQNKLIKTYQDSESKHNAVVNKLNIELLDMININKELIIRYNNLRTEVSRLKRMDVLFNRHKDILVQYPKLTGSIDDLTINTTPSTDE